MTNQKRPLTDAKLDYILLDVQSAQKQAEQRILETKTGSKRNLLTEVNLHLMQAAQCLHEADNHTDGE